MDDNVLNRMITVDSLKDKLVVRKKLGEGDFTDPDTKKSTHFEVGLILPFTMYVEANGKIAILNMGEVVPECLRRIDDEG